MFNKSFKEMMAIDVSSFVAERDGADYLNWAICKKLLHDNGAEVVMFYPIAGADGSTLRKSSMSFADKDKKTNSVYEVLVHIKVDDIEWDICYPVMNGNNPVKDNSMNQLRVHNAIRRAFVKGVAERLGLGFSLWLKEDDLPDEPIEDLSKHSLVKIRQRLEELITAKINMGLSFNVIADRLGLDEDGLRGKFSLFNELYNLEKKIGEMEL